MEILNLHWKWDNKFTPILELHPKQLKHILKQLDGRVYYNVDSFTWRRSISAILLADKALQTKQAQKLLVKLNG